jgi:hypothetical protein
MSYIPGDQSLYGSTQQGGQSGSNQQSSTSILDPQTGQPYSGYQQYQQTPGAQTANAGSNLTYGQSAIPQLNFNNVAQTQANPLQPSYVSAPTGQATQFAGAQLGQIDPSVLQMLSPNSSVQALYSQFAPAQAQATRSLNDNLAAMGLVGGPALNAQTNLQQQLTSGLGNSISGLIQNSQGNQLNALENQAGLTQQTGLANQSALNQMTSQNLANQFGANTLNSNAYNNAGSQYAQMLQQAYNNNLSNFNQLNNAGYEGQTNLAGQALGGTQSLAGSELGMTPQVSTTASILGF